MLKIIDKLIRLLTGSTKELYYINGPDVLPQPLEAEEEARLIEEKDEDPSVRSVLVEHNLRLVVYIAKKFENTGVGIEDLISIGTIGLIKAINTFKSDKNIKLATYASRCIENEILMYIRKSSNQRTEMSIDEPLNTDWDGNELLLSDILGGDEDSVYKNIENEEERRILLEAVSTLCERDREIISRRFALNGGKELTQKEVADQMGISQSYISRLEKKIIDKLKRDISAKV
ncbi:MAG: RNA polymerase sporulation sigma factor SigE [Clostridia bacterium]|nr:RNA polymerase sporulation sigma factor SigE [Clostridia bacterium]MBQ4601308.1 RNA polymerase sporulation sigma factor SigE [Clostridia bacterium]